MTFDIAPPSRNPTVDGKLKSVLRFVFEKLVQGDLDDMLPAMIVDYSRTTNLATVQPLIQIVTTLNQLKNRDPIESVPVLQLGGGGFVLNFPLKSGDLGFIKSNDRDISLFKQIWQLVQPNTGRMHNFSDSIFIPSVLTNFTINGTDTNNAVLQSIDGTTRLSMGEGNFCMSDEPSYTQSQNAILDLQSTTRAFKLPCMTTIQKNLIPSPQQGFMVYDITENAISLYNGSTWS